jgi:hypothetical protein
MVMPPEPITSRVTGLATATRHRAPARTLGPSDHVSEITPDSHSNRPEKDHCHTPPALPAGHRPRSFLVGQGGRQLSRLTGHGIGQYAHLQQCWRPAVLALLLGDPSLKDIWGRRSSTYAA